MSIIDYSEMHRIALPVQHMGIINSIIDPTSYLRLFTNSNAKKQEKGKNDKSNTYTDMKELEEQIRIGEERSKNLISLILIYRAIKSSKYENGYCTINVNTMLAFELYITFSHHINQCKYKLDKLYEKQEKIDLLSSEYQSIQQEITDLFSEYEALKEINDTVVRSLRPEALYQLSLDYAKFTSEEHARRCLK